MNDEDRTKEQLIIKVIELRKQIADLKVSGTMSKQYEEALKISEYNYRTVLENTYEPIYVAQNGMLKYVNKKAIRTSGYSEEELKSRPFIDFIHPDDREYVMARHMQRLKGENPDNLYQYRLIDKCGNTRWMELKVTRIVWDGEPATLNFINDITEQKLTQEALRLSEERFYKAFKFNPAPMVVTSLDGRLLNVNNAMLNYFCFDRNEVIGNSIKRMNLFVNEDNLNYLLMCGSTNNTISNMEIHLRIKSGEIRIGLLSTETIDVAREKCLLVVIQDITERKQMEREMARLSKLNLIGEMAAGIAHEVRNPMTTVRGFLQLLGNKKECIKYKEYYDIMIDELDRANLIITEFLSLARDKADNLQLQNLNSIVESIYPLIEADAMNFNKDVKVKKEEVPDILLNEKEIRQLLLNLARNGLEAMSSGGTLFIRTYIEQKEVILLVQDEGKGIESDLIEKLGTPFFTTKPDGTGLGLAISYSIAKRHNAKIEVKSGTSGTSFYVRFTILNKISMFT